MARYLVSINAADDTAAQSAITTAGGSVERTLSFGLTYEIEATAEQVAAISGLVVSEAKDTAVTAELQGATFTRTHLDKCIHYSGERAWNPANTGTGQTVYLVDTGINTSHQEFAGKLIVNLYSNFMDNDSIGNFTDEVGHGTMVASVIIGDQIGTAKDCTLQNIKLFNAVSGSVTVGEIIDALAAILTHHNANDNTKAKVVCLPWTIPSNAFVNAKVQELNDSNLVVVAAAGNAGADVSTVSPAGVKNIITVGSFNDSLQVTSFTNAPYNSTTGWINFGAEVDSFAIGVDVPAADYANVSNYVDATGTSISAGITAGIVTHHIERSPSENSSWIKEAYLMEGHSPALFALTFDNANASVDYDGVYKSMATTKNVDSRVLTSKRSGRILNVQSGQTGTVNLGISADASNISVLAFAPTPPFITANVSTGVVSVDATSIDANLSPGVYLFAMRGEVANATLVEEYSIGIYTSDISELSESANVTSYYYDDDNDEYDEVVEYQTATPFQKP